MSKRRQGTEAAIAERPDRIDRLRQVAHQRLDQLLDDATAGRFWGRVSIEIAVENGIPHAVHRRIEGLDK